MGRGWESKNGWEIPARSVYWVRYGSKYRSHSFHHFFALLGLIEVMVQGMECAVRKAPDIGIGAVLGLVFKGTDHFFMVRDHHIHIGLIEVLTGFAIQVIDILLHVGR